MIFVGVVGFEPTPFHYMYQIYSLAPIHHLSSTPIFISMFIYFEGSIGIGPT